MQLSRASEVNMTANAPVLNKVKFTMFGIQSRFSNIQRKGEISTY